MSTSAADKNPSGEASKGRGRGKAATGPLEIDLQDGRWRHFGWAVLGLGLGGVLVLELGTLGKLIGAALLVLAAYNLWRFARSLQHPGGRIRVAGDGVVLPVGLCRDDASKFEVGELRHAFFLRRAVPWTKAGPLLIVEAGDEVFTYPRDWFESDSDQRRVAMAINKLLDRG